MPDSGVPLSMVQLPGTDLSRIAAVLLDSGLTPDGLDADHVLVFAAVQNEMVVGCAALEVLGEIGLVRSIAVSSGLRRRGTGSALLRTVEEEAMRSGLRKLYLLTETAQSFFAARNYRAVVRDGLPDALVRTEQFASICPASAVVMTRDLYHPE